jgi:chloride channel protein, CIC family
MTRLLLLAGLAGALTAVAVAAFKVMVGGMEWLAFGWAGEDWAAAPALVILLVPALGGLLVGLALDAAGVPEDPGHGVTEVIEAATMDLEEFPHRQVPVKASLAAVSLGSGASLGPEDPAVEIGGGVGEWLGRRWRLPHDAVRALVAAGAGGGISALLYAPLSGILFSIEVFAVRIRSRVVVLIATSSVVAFLGMSLLIPRSPLDLGVGIGALEPMPVRSLLFCLTLGVLAGLASAVQIRLSYAIREGFVDRVPTPRWVKPAFGGLLLGAAGLVLPELLGIGYGTIESIIGGETHSPTFLAGLLVGKMLLLGLSFGSGLLGGFFAPAFFIGTTLGALLAVIAGGWLAPGVEPGVLALMGTAAALAGMVHAPFAAAAAVAGLSRSWGLLPFLMVTCLVSHWTARRLIRGSMYTYAMAAPGPGPAGGRGDAGFGSQPDLAE